MPKPSIGFGFLFPIGGIEMEKKIQRNNMLTILNRMDETEHEKLSQIIVDRFISSEEFKRAQIIGITISRFPEVNTIPLIEAAWAAGKRVTVPRCIPKTREMDFREITTFNNLKIDYMDLLEPIVAETEAVKKENVDIQIVPGVVYSNNGYRIGYGGGYYDRYLNDFSGIIVSLALECQIVSTVPIESHDIPVSKLFTERRLITCLKDEWL